MAKKIAVNLSKPMPASNDCLPHAAMTLGSGRGVGTRPGVGMVSRIIIEPISSGWVMHRLDAGGGFVGDTNHATRDDAVHQAKKEFGVVVET